MSAERPFALIAGAGAGLGAALCRAFLQRGYAVAALSRALSPEIDEDKVRVKLLNLAEGAAVNAAFDELEAEFGAPDVVIYNAHQLVIRPFLELRAHDFRRAWESGVLGAFHVSQRALPGMSKGTLLFTGATASRRGAADFSAFASAKFALRGLAQSLAREFGPRGIHVAHVLIDGLIWCPQTVQRFAPERSRCIEPEALAQVYLSLVDQAPSAWTQELDLRTAVEAF